MRTSVNRGNPSLLKSIQSSAKKVSEHNGISESSIISNNPIHVSPVSRVDYGSTGAYASMMKRNQKEIDRSVSTTNHVNESINFELKLYERLTESVESVGETKEYFNATSSLFTLYALGKLNESTMSSLSIEDLREIKGIVREFKSIIDSY